MGEFSYCYIKFILSNIQQYVLVDVTSLVSKATRGENHKKNNKTPVSYELHDVVEMFFMCNSHDSDQLLK